MCTGLYFSVGSATPTNLDALSEEELRQLEGVERQNVEARIRLLQRIQSLLDSAVTLMGQYSAVTAPMGETMSTSAPAATNFVSQASQSEEVPAQLESSQLLISSIASKSEGIPINKLMPVEEDGRTSDNATAGQGDEDVNLTRPADSSEIRKRRLEKLVSREADHPQQAQSEETRDDKADT